MAGAERERRRYAIRGLVQGVGFRPYVYRLARELGLGGSVRNGLSGVDLVVEGPASAVAAFGRRLAAELPPPGRIESCQVTVEPPCGERSFAIIASEAAGAEVAWVLPDLATCPACRAEILDPADRRHGYAFTNCTHCGPRFTIVREVPYDRAHTTMAGFTMCPTCAGEYAAPGDRRFHAQPNACPVCGPRLRLLAPTGEPLEGDPVAGAADLLRRERIVAVKGLGGYHLACDARSAKAVGRLRERKQREARPLAVMVADVAMAAELALVSPAAAAALSAPAAPIVLLPQRPAAALAREVAPDVTTVGVMLAYTPLHVLLLAAVGGPLVMTSGNRTDEPIAHDDADALARLAEIADAFLSHDRPIQRRCDDSVVAVWREDVVPFRRSRGYAPEPVVVGPAAALIPDPSPDDAGEGSGEMAPVTPVELTPAGSGPAAALTPDPSPDDAGEGSGLIAPSTPPLPHRRERGLGGEGAVAGEPGDPSRRLGGEGAVAGEPGDPSRRLGGEGAVAAEPGAPARWLVGEGAGPTVLAVGGHQKNTFCLLRGHEAFLSHHLGDLENEAALAAFETGIADFQRLFDLQPAILAHDLHPDYLATRYALDRAAAEGLPTVAVQHHHAHVASCLADQGRDEPVVGVAFDGTGLGVDQTIWGGEVLVANRAGFRRAAALRPFRLAGGEAAVRQGWRVALELARQAGVAAPVAGLDPARVEFVGQMLDQDLRCLATTSAGRLFDGFSALLGCRTDSRYEGEAAVALEGACARSVAGELSFTLDERPELWELDWRPAVREAVELRAAGRSVGDVAMRFHRGLATAVVRLCAVVADEADLSVVALSGGCFQNLLLLDLLVEGLQDRGLTVLTHRRVPPNDGGLALGQAVVAAALAKGL